ncbi:hypothetical protein [Okeania sp. SIO2C9]|nr:hypothetical protein [Okeania sp. SIO2C9]
MITSYHNFFGDATRNTLPFFGASQDDYFLDLCISNINLLMG